MSILSEINRISENVEDALDAIEEKGVTIPSGANSNDLAYLISQIDTGGGVGGITQDEDGYLVLSPDGPGASPSGGLEFETGTYTPTSDVAKPTISFANTHANPPVIIYLCDASEEDYVVDSWKKFMWLDVYQMRNSPIPVGNGDNNYATAYYSARTSSTALSNWSYDVKYPFSNEGSSTTSYYRYWVTNLGFSPSQSNTSRYYRAGRTYKWIAVWAPST